MAKFNGDDLSESRLSYVDFSRSVFRDVNFTGVVMRGVELVDVDIDGEIENVVINGVDVGPLIEAELDRREPDRVKLRSTDPEGIREGWQIVQRRWDATVARARRLDPEMLHESVDDEYTFIETLRHLVFATDAWIRRAILGDPAPWHPLGLPWDGMPDTPGVPRDRTARPSLDEILEVRRDRMATVTKLVQGLTPESLAAHTEPVEGPGWPPPRSFPVLKCLHIILNEEWWHRVFAERDLAVLEGR